MKNKKRKAKIKLLRHRLDYLQLKLERHEKILKIQMAELKDIEAGLKRLVVMATVLNTKGELK